MVDSILAIIGLHYKIYMIFQLGLHMIYNNLHVTMFRTIQYLVGMGNLTGIMS